MYFSSRGNPSSKHRTSSQIRRYNVSCPKSISAAVIVAAAEVAAMALISGFSITTAIQPHSPITHHGDPDIPKGHLVPTNIADVPNIRSLIHHRPTSPRRAQEAPCGRNKPPTIQSPRQLSSTILSTLFRTHRLHFDKGLPGTTSF